MQWPFSPPVLSGFPMEVFPNSCSCSGRAQISFPQGFKLTWITLSSSQSRSGFTNLGTACIIPAHFASRDLPAPQESGRIAVGWVFPPQDIPQAAFWHWELAFPAFPSPFPAGFNPPSHLKGVQSCLWNVEYPGWMKHGCPGASSGCGFAPLGRRWTQKFG